MKTIETVIQYAEYSISLLRWGITSLRSFPVIQKTKTNESEQTRPDSEIRGGV